MPQPKSMKGKGVAAVAQPVCKGPAFQNVRAVVGQRRGVYSQEAPEPGGFPVGLQDLPGLDGPGGEGFFEAHRRDLISPGGDHFLHLGGPHGRGLFQ